jgi:nuclear pore complex protein Nup98-Nup96
MSNSTASTGFGSNANTGTSIFGSNNTTGNMFGGGNNNTSSPFGGGGTSGTSNLSRQLAPSPVLRFDSHRHTSIITH